MKTIFGRLVIVALCFLTACSPTSTDLTEDPPSPERQRSYLSEDLSSERVPSILQLPEKQTVSESVLSTPQLPEKQTFDEGVPVLALLRAECQRVPNPIGGLEDLLCSGTVKNIGSEEIKTASVVIMFYRNDGSPVGKDEVPIRTLPLAPGMVSTFLVNRYDIDANVSARKWDISFQTFFEDPIPMKDER
ncbi:MAG: hypothetical protein O7G29_14340 [Acidobacteria bacterium]|nr:hypothetical protein [Acidobacteriota bacterium]